MDKNQEVLLNAFAEDLAWIKKHLQSQTKKEQVTATEPVQLDGKEIKAISQQIDSLIEALRSKFSRQDKVVNQVVSSVATQEQLLKTCGQLENKIQFLTDTTIGNRREERSDKRTFSISFLVAMFFLITTMGAVYYANSQSEKIEILERRASEARYRLWWMQRAYPENYSNAMEYYKANRAQINSETDSLIRGRVNN